MAPHTILRFMPRVLQQPHPGPQIKFCFQGLLFCNFTLTSHLGDMYTLNGHSLMDWGFLLTTKSKFSWQEICSITSIKTSRCTLFYAPKLQGHRRIHAIQLLLISRFTIASRHLIIFASIDCKVNWLML